MGLDRRGNGAPEEEEEIRKYIHHTCLCVCVYNTVLFYVCVLHSKHGHAV